MKITVPKLQTRTRLDLFLTSMFPEHSRSYWQQSITNKIITVNDIACAKHLFLKEGDVIDIQDEKKQKSPQPIPFPNMEIIAETDDYIVINKPVGLLSHESKKSGDEGTVAQWALAHNPSIAGVGDEPTTRPGIVHRLDRDVSGVMILAKTQQSYNHLKQQFEERLVKKMYIGLAHGTDFDEHFELSFRVLRNNKTGLMKAIPTSSAEGKPAHTICNVVKRFGSSTLLHIFPTTGRTHQIRVHLFGKGTPLVGDTLYMSKNYIRDLDDAVGRIFLHASSLSFVDMAGETQTFSSTLPQNLEQFLSTLKERV